MTHRFPPYLVLVYIRLTLTLTLTITITITLTLTLIRDPQIPNPCVANPLEAMWLTGSYDHTARLWDVRMDGSKSALKLDHGAPVESVCFFPGGGLCATAGGTEVRRVQGLGFRV